MKREINWTAISLFIFSLGSISAGIKFLLEDKVIVGQHRDNSLNVVGSGLLLLVGLTFLYIAYHSLSPYGKIRRFFEDQSINKSKRK